MADIQNIQFDSYQAKLAAFNRQLQELAHLLLKDEEADIPVEVAFELQHMLGHLVSAGNMANHDYVSKNEEIGHSLGHLDRAFMDECKILVASQFATLKNNIAFMREWIKIRQKEWKRHFRDQAHDLGNNDKLIPLEIKNHICEQFLRILSDFEIIGSPTTAVVVTVHPNQNIQWKMYAEELEWWFCLDALYNALYCKKSYSFLNILIRSLWTLDAERLKRYNTQMKLNILVLNSAYAIKNGWSDEIMKRHFEFVEEYTEDDIWKEHELSSEKNWINKTFYSFCEFYGIAQVLPLEN